ncbi:MAG: methyltransferase domain-containing protein [Planctomycetes bacterium]|nr:methyltransferase domain-containing protein [Planctomycetota bacterium]
MRCTARDAIHRKERTTDTLNTKGVVLRRAAYLYDLLEPAMMFFRHNAMASAMSRALNLSPTHKVLDIGCGTGLVTKKISVDIPQGNALGVDASPEMINIAKHKRESECCHFENALAESLPFESASFDAAMSSMFFHHVDLKLKLACLNEMKRVVKPGGRVVIADLDRPWSWFGNFYGYSGYIFFRQPEIKENLEGCMPSLMTEAGISEITAVASFLGCIKVWQGIF